MASELESDPQGTVYWGKKWTVDFNAGKTQLFLLDQSNNTGAIDVKMDRSATVEKQFFFFWIGAYIISITTTASKKIELDP